MKSNILQKFLLLLFAGCTFSVPDEMQSISVTGRSEPSTGKSKPKTETTVTQNNMLERGDAFQTFQEALHTPSAKKEKIDLTSLLENFAGIVRVFVHTESSKFDIVAHGVVVSVVDNSHCYVVTNAHFILPLRKYPKFEISVKNENQSLDKCKAILVGAEEEADLCLLKVLSCEATSKLKPIRLASSVPVSGSEAFLLGFTSNIFETAVSLRKTHIKEVRVNFHFDHFDYQDAILLSKVTFKGESGSSVCSPSGLLFGITAVSWEKNPQTLLISFLSIRKFLRNYKEVVYDE
jgi:S1-C subfamily serine protease